MSQLIYWCIARIKELQALLNSDAGTLAGQLANLQAQVAALTSGAVTQQVLQYDVDPTSEGIIPSNQDLSAICYQKDGILATRTWNTTSHAWQ